MSETKYVQMTLSDWMSIKGQLELELRGAAASFVRIGYYLRKIEETEGYRNDGAESLTEWAYDNYGMDKTAVSRFMAINAKYSIDGYSEQLKQEYALYGSSKLAEMLALPDADMEMVSPQMKREDIRKIKKFNKEAAKEAAIEEKEQAKTALEETEEMPVRRGTTLTNGDSAIAENTEAEAAPAEDLPAAVDGEQGEGTEPKKILEYKPAEESRCSKEHQWIIEFFRENGKLMNELYSSEAYVEQKTDAMREIVNPAGARTFRHKATMVSMLDNRIMVKVFPSAPVPMSWEEFFQTAEDIFADNLDGPNTYRNVFGADPEEEAETEQEKDKKTAEKEKSKEPANKGKNPTKSDSAVAPAQPEKEEKEPAKEEGPTETVHVSGSDTDRAQAAAAEEEVEHVEVAEVIPTPVDPDSLPGLKERFRTELNTLQVLLDTDRFDSMQLTIERLEHIRKKMEGLKK